MALFRALISRASTEAKGMNGVVTNRPQSRHSAPTTQVSQEPVNSPVLCDISPYSVHPSLKGEFVQTCKTWFRAHAHRA
eukprot:6206884-Pleurochrysis_carterae.AAC.2